MKRVNLSIFNFKKFLYVVEIALLLFFLSVMGNLLNYILVNDISDYEEGTGIGASWERALLNEFYAQDKIENLYLGSSHVYCDIIPTQLDAINGQSNFNLATAGQPMNASYYLLKEAYKKFPDISHVYLEMYYQIPSNDGILKENIVAMTRNWEILYQMPMSVNKLQYMIDAGSKEYYAMTFFSARRFAGHIFDDEYIQTNVRAKESEGYESGMFYGNYGALYQSKGFMHSVQSLEQFLQEEQTDEEKGSILMEPDAEKYVRRIIEFCQEKGIGITLYTSPMAEFQTLREMEYDPYVEQVSAIAREYGISYYDFNLCSTEILDLGKPSYFRDMGHLNAQGAEVFTPVFADVMMRESAGDKLPEEMFYSSYEQRRTAEKNIGQAVRN